MRIQPLPGDAWPGLWEFPASLLPNTALSWRELPTARAAWKEPAEVEKGNGIEAEIMREWRLGRASVGTKWQNHMYNPPTFKFTHPTFPPEVLLSDALPNKNRQVIRLVQLALAPATSWGLGTMKPWLFWSLHHHWPSPSLHTNPAGTLCPCPSRPLSCCSWCFPGNHTQHACFWTQWEPCLTAPVAHRFFPLTLSAKRYM